VEQWIIGFATQELIPSNCLFTGDGMVMVMDGSAKLSSGCEQWLLVNLV